MAALWDRSGTCLGVFRQAIKPECAARPTPRRRRPRPHRRCPPLSVPLQTRRVALPARPAPASGDPPRRGGSSIGAGQRAGTGPCTSATAGEPRIADSVERVVRAAQQPRSGAHPSNSPRSLTHPPPPSERRSRRGRRPGRASPSAVSELDPEVMQALRRGSPASSQRRDHARRRGGHLSEAGAMPPRQRVKPVKPSQAGRCVESQHPTPGMRLLALIAPAARVAVALRDPPAAKIAQCLARRRRQRLRGARRRRRSGGRRCRACLCRWRGFLSSPSLGTSQPRLPARARCCRSGQNCCAARCGSSGGRARNAQRRHQRGEGPLAKTRRRPTRRGSRHTCGECFRATAKPLPTFPSQ